MKNILLMNFGGIGDEILFLPTIESLKLEYPDSTITLILEPRSASIKELTQLIDDVIFCDIKAGGIKKYFNILSMLRTVRKRKFDMLISSGSSPLVAILSALTGVKKRYGYKSKTSFLYSASTPLNKNQYASCMYHDLISPVAKQKCTIPKINIKSDFPLPFEGEYVAIHPGVSKLSVQKNMIKCPSPAFWKKLIAELLERGEKIALLGGRDDEEIIAQIAVEHQNFKNLYGKTGSLMDMAQVINGSKAFICVDSAPMHVGVALNKNIVAIFGPTDENKLIPKQENFKVIHATCPLRPCLWEKRQTTCETLECLNIDVKSVMEAVPLS